MSGQEALDKVTVCMYTYCMIMDLLAHKDYIRVLLALEDKPLRFSALEKALKLNPTQLDRALKFLRKGHWVIPHVDPGEGGRFFVSYRLSKRGIAFLRSFNAFSKEAQRSMASVGSSEVRELQSLYR